MKKKFNVLLFSGIAIISVYFVILLLNCFLVIKNMPLNQNLWENLIFTGHCFILFYFLITFNNKKMLKVISAVAIVLSFIIINNYSYNMMKWEDFEHLQKYNNYIFVHNHYLLLDNYVFLKDERTSQIAYYYNENGFFSKRYEIKTNFNSETRDIITFQFKDKKIVTIKSNNCNEDVINDINGTLYLKFNNDTKNKKICIFGKIVDEEYESKIELGGKEYTIN